MLCTLDIVNNYIFFTNMAVYIHMYISTYAHTIIWHTYVYA